MSKFKVGDRVRRVIRENMGGTFGGDSWLLPVGATATVCEVNYFDELGIKDCLGSTGNVTRECVMSAEYFELVQEPAKQAAKAGGLQEHSLGDCYPYAVVGYGNGGKTTFVVENLQTGEVALRDGKLVTGDAASACRIQWLASKDGWLAGWSNERPKFLNGVLSLPSEPAVLYATSLAEQEVVLGRELTPREQYQLAMAIGKG